MNELFTGFFILGLFVLTLSLLSIPIERIRFLSPPLIAMVTELNLLRKFRVNRLPREDRYRS
ncbi:MAG: hypothetical protein ACOH5I_08825 [Oligoflexus sp.]